MDRPPARAKEDVCRADRTPKSNGYESVNGDPAAMARALARAGPGQSHVENEHGLFPRKIRCWPVSIRVGKRDTENTDLFIRDLRERVIGQPEISTDGFLPYLPAIRDAFGKGAVHGQIIKTYSVVDLRPQASIRYSPCEVVAVEREVVSGLPMQISTSYVERSNLSLRMASRRFTRLTNGFSKKLDNHVAAVSLYVAHFNLCRVHETLRTTPAVAIGIADHVWSIGELLDAVLATQPIDPVVTAPDRRRRFRVIEGGKS